MDRMQYLIGKEKTETKVLYEEIFNDSKEYVEYYYNDSIVNNKVLAAFADDQLVSMLHLIPKNMSIGTACYIYAVATKEQFRCLRYMGRLLRKALKDMHAEGMSFTFLIPENPLVYKKYGFTSIYYQNSFLYSAEYLQKYSYSDTFEQIHLETFQWERDLKELIQFADDSIAEEYNQYIVHDESYFKKIIEELSLESGEILLAKEAGSIVGYTYAVNITNLTLLEFVCRNGIERIFLSHIVKKYNKNVIIIKGFKNSSYSNLYHIHGVKTAANQMKIMIRILDVKQFLEGLLNTNQEILEHIFSKKDYTISIRDEIIMENNATYKISMDSLLVRVIKVNEKADLSMSINELADILTEKGLLRTFINEET